MSPRVSIFEVNKPHGGDAERWARRGEGGGTETTIPLRRPIRSFPIHHRGPCDLEWVEELCGGVVQGAVCTNLRAMTTGGCRGRPRGG